MMYKLVSFIEMCLRIWDWVVLSAKFVKKYWAVATAGIVVSALLWLGDVRLATIIYWGGIISFVAMGLYIATSKERKKIYNFCRVSLKASGYTFILTAAATALKPFFSPNEVMQVITGPLLNTSFLIVIASIIGLALTAEMPYPADE